MEQEKRAVLVCLALLQGPLYERHAFSRHGGTTAHMIRMLHLSRLLQGPCMIGMAFSIWGILASGVKPHYLIWAQVRDALMDAARQRVEDLGEAATENESLGATLERAFAERFSPEAAAAAHAAAKGAPKAQTAVEEGHIGTAGAEQGAPASDAAADVEADVAGSTLQSAAAVPAAAAQEAGPSGGGDALELKGAAAIAGDAEEAQRGGAAAAAGVEVVPGAAAEVSAAGAEESLSRAHTPAEPVPALEADAAGQEAAESRQEGLEGARAGPPVEPQDVHMADQVVAEGGAAADAEPQDMQVDQPAAVAGAAEDGPAEATAAVADADAAEAGSALQAEPHQAAAAEPEQDSEEEDDEPLPAALDQAERRLLDWHWSNLEYGCSARLDQVLYLIAHTFYFHLASRVIEFQILLCCARQQLALALTPHLTIQVARAA